MVDHTLSDAIFNDDRWIEQLTVTRKGDATNDGGYADEPTTSTEQVRAVVRPARARYWRQVTEGVSTTGAYLMVVREGATVEQGDKVTYRSQDYRVKDAETDFLDGFTIYELEEVTE